MARIPVARGAAIYLQAESRLYWYDDWRERGRRVRLSLQTSDAAEAMRKARILYDERSNPVLTLGQALDKYQEDYGRRNRESSLDRTMGILRPWAEWVGPDRPAREVERRHLIEWRDRRMESTSRWTVNGELGRLRTFCRWMLAEGILEKDQTLGVRGLKVPRLARETLSRETVVEVLSALEGHAWLPDYVGALAETGMRPEEALHVRGCDLDADRALLKIRAWGDWQLKDSEDRSLALNESALAILSRRKLQAGNDELPLFASRAGTPRDRRNVYHEYKEVLRLAVAAKNARPSLVETTLYDFRHGFATQCAEAGWPLERLSKYLGHSSTEVKLQYYADLRALSTVGAPPVLTARRVEA